MKKTFLTVIVFVLVSITFVQAQDLTETLTKMAGSAAQGYVQPVASGFGANLNGGWFHKSPQTKIFGIDLELGLVAMATFTTDENKTFSANGGFRFGGGTPGSGSQAEDIAKNIPNYASLPALQKQQVIDAISSKEFQVGITGPTIVGTKQDTMKIAIPSQTITANGQTYTINGNTQTLDGVVGVLDGSAIIPLFAPQASIGTIYGTQFTFRFLPELEVSPEIGKFKYFGFGIQHNLGMWLPIPVVDVSASFFTQNLKVGTIFESKATAFGLNASKQLGFAFLNVTPYAGFMLESSKMNVTYNFEVDKGNGVMETIPVAFELEGENKSRITLGLGIRLLVININVDYNIGKQNSATAGVFFAF
ncbi:MAG: hypothetical protein Q8L88_02970 [Bacteroidota bacterium]|nr:hypothetical protein [Bacteroidota bacterium]